ncbi:MAG: hypothetical protein HUU47_03835 [Bacteroidetes bacterium]|nr:hypothetical protein [Bacteroidota bacterium]
MIVSVILLLCLFNFPAKIKLLLSVLPILFLILFFKKYILNIEFSNYSIKIKYQKFIRTEIKEILVSEIENFELESYYISRGGGYFYFVKLKNNNNKIPLLTIPFLYMNEENKSKINEFLKNITGKEILK